MSGRIDTAFRIVHAAGTFKAIAKPVLQAHTQEGAKCVLTHSMRMAVVRVRNTLVQICANISTGYACAIPSRRDHAILAAVATDSVAIVALLSATAHAVAATCCTDGPVSRESRRACAREGALGVRARRGLVTVIGIGRALILIQANTVRIHELPLVSIDAFIPDVPRPTVAELRGVPAGGV